MARIVILTIFSVLAITVSVFLNVAHGLRVSSFNIKRFGHKAMLDPVRSAHIVDILKHFDVVLILELNDKRNKTIPLLLNTLETTTKVKWDFSASVRVGRSKYYMEQYLYVYRTDKLKILKEHQVVDDTFIRPPYAILTQYTYRGKTKQVGFMAIHTEPKNVPKELSKLGQTIEDVHGKLGKKESVLITMGDFNADCSFLSNKAEKALEIFKGGKFDSLIPDEWDTAVATTSDCAYDRIIAYPSGQPGPKSVSVFNLEKELKITNDQAKTISDHYPIRFYLR